LAAGISDRRLNRVGAGARVGLAALDVENPGVPDTDVTVPVLRLEPSPDTMGPVNCEVFTFSLFITP